MLNTKYLKPLLLLIALLLLEACASINKAPEYLDAEAKLFKPDPDYSTVYLYRNEMLGSALSMSVMVNCEYMGNTGPGSYFKFILPEAKHAFISQDGESSLILDTKKGKQYFIWQEIIMGLMHGSTLLHLVDDSQGKKGVLESVLISPSAERQDDSDDLDDLDDLDF